MYRKALILILITLFAVSCATTPASTTSDTSTDPNRKTKRGAAHELRWICWRDHFVWITSRKIGTADTALGQPE